MASLEREQIRHEHAKWSDSTFGCVGPIGPLKHLSKEALEAAAEPDDLSEWADMQFLLWDSQRRAGISDAEITAAMEDKLKINMERQWPEPKDGEPRLHIKEPGNSPVIPDGLIPMQPLVIDHLGTLRFKENPIVRSLLDYASERGYGLNEIACAQFDAEDQMQLAQLIGYSLSGYGTLSYVTDESYNRAAAAAPQQE
ncbi:DUF550 domain-containing protein [Escherichia coli]|uniref:DUF550 domain-containing protein n=1 Tax=Escherichia coli TaxID=562 RepID=UPI002413F508|nr:DUF550 domain-containing protein [Escherichia coli]WFM64683.1 DUF550 domain-containing protein [Escherichia coli]